MKKLIYLLLLIPILCYGQQFERRLKTTVSPYGYLESLPSDYANKESWPLLIFLHGYGENGNGTDELNKLCKTGLPKLLFENKAPECSGNFIVLSPQSPSDKFYLQNVEKFIKYAIQTYRVDTTRIYLTGLSGGAITGYNYIRTYNRLAAVVLISGSGNYSKVCTTQAVNTPVWAFHGTADPTVPLSGSTAFNFFINLCSQGERARITAYDGGPHNVWDRTYNLSGMNSYSTGFYLQGKIKIYYDPFDQSIYTWLLKHTKSKNI